MNVQASERPLVLFRTIPGSSLRRTLAGLALIVALGLCACGKRDAPETQPADEPSESTIVAVLFFQNQDPHPDTDWIGRGIAQLLSMRLEQHDRLDVVRYSRLETALRSMGRTDSAELTEKTLLEAARRTEAARAVLGDYRISAGQFLINARLVDVVSGALVAEKQVQGLGPQNLYQMADQIAGTLSDGFGIAVAQRKAGTESTGDLTAYEAFIRAQEAFRRFDTSKGMALLNRSVTRDTNFTLAYASQAIQAYSIGDLPRATAAVRHASSHPERLSEPERLMIEAIRDHLFGKYEQGFKTLERLRNTIRPDPEIYLVLAQMFYTIQDHASAEKIYQDLLRQDPNNVVAHIMLGLNQLELELPDLAQSELEEALRLKPDHPYAHIAMSRINAYQGNLEEAEHQLHEASRLDPEDPWIHNQLGYFYLSQNKLETALKEFKRYVELAPDDPNAHDSLAEGYLRNGNKSMAEKEYLLALKLKPDFDNPHFMLGRMYEDRGETQKAVRMFQRYLQINPRGPMAKEAEVRLEAIGNR